MTEDTHRNLDDLISGYDKDVRILILDKGRRWFELCDGRVGQEHEIEKAVSNLLETIREANALVGGNGYVDDFDFMLGREMSERPDLLLTDKPKFEAALYSRLKAILPGFENIGEEVDLGLALTAYGRLVFKNGQPKPAASTFIERLRERISDRISANNVIEEFVGAIEVYSAEINAGKMDLDSFRSNVLQNNAQSIYNALSELGVEKENLQKVNDFKVELEVRNVQSFALSG